MQTAIMAITRSSTQAEIIGEYLDNLNYDMNGSASECKLFIAACRALLVMHPGNWQHSQSSIQFDQQQWKNQLDAALDWLNSNNTTSAGNATGGVTHLAFGGDWR